MYSYCDLWPYVLFIGNAKMLFCFPKLFFPTVRKSCSTERKHLLKFSYKIHTLMVLLFRLFGVKKRGWGAKLIGFREVLLATEGISKLSKPDEILRWIFRVYDQHAVGEISVYKIESMMNSILW